MAPDRSAGTTGDDSRVVVLVPIKTFDQAKNRLATRLDPEARMELARTMARQVLAAAAPHDVRVVCDDPAVAEFAAAEGAGVVHVEVAGLNPAITAAVAQVTPEADHVIIAHADLPRATSLDGLVEPGAVTIVPDRHHDGTNVMALPTGVGFNFAYGRGSLHAHIAEALRCGLDVTLRQVVDLQWDVDTPDDLDETS